MKRYQAKARGAEDRRARLRLRAVRLCRGPDPGSRRSAKPRASITSARQIHPQPQLQDRGRRVRVRQGRRMVEAPRVARRSSRTSSRTTSISSAGGQSSRSCGRRSTRGRDDLSLRRRAEEVAENHTAHEKPPPGGGGFVLGNVPLRSQRTNRFANRNQIAQENFALTRSLRSRASLARTCRFSGYRHPPLARNESFHRSESNQAGKVFVKALARIRARR